MPYINYHKNNFDIKKGDENSRYLQFGSKNTNNVPDDLRSLQPAEEVLVNVKEVNGTPASEHSSSVPRLPSIRNNRPTASGLRKLQVHLAKAQGETSDLEVLEEE